MGKKMIEAKYFRDYKHSYMILPCRSAQPEKKYTCRLLTSGKLEEILCCSLRHVNGAAYFYYDISSRTTLENLYRGRQLSFGNVKELFGQLYEIYGRLGDYFMDEKKLVLLPEYIFYDLSQKKYIGLYYPDYEEDKPYEALMDYLLEHMDSLDERLADVIYQIYERTEESNFSLCDALRMIGEKEEIYVMKEAETKKEASFVSDSSSMSAEALSLEDDFCFRSESSETEEKREKPASKKKNLFSVFLTGFSILGIAGIACVYKFYELSDQEMTTLLGCGALMGVCLFAGLAGLLRGGGKKEKKEKAAALLQEENDPPVLEAATLEGVLFREAEPQFGMSETRDKNGADTAEAEREFCGNTVFFDHTRIAEYKLYALDRRNKKHIELTKFPYTIGKMAGCVDCVLADDSVSRIHARFEKEGNAIRLTDMNSTNGTYKNGLRLQPQETVEIEPGDEIRFGNLNYCYR